MTSPETLRHYVTHSFNYVFLAIIYALSWFCLWNISRHLLSDFLLAALFLPTGLRLALYALAPKRYWLLCTLCDISLSVALIPYLAESPTAYLVILFAVIAHVLSSIFSPFIKVHEVYWQRLLILCGLSTGYAMLCGATLLLLAKPLGVTAHYALEATITAFNGGILLLPFFYLLYDYLSRKVWRPLSPTLVHHEVRLRASALIWGALFFSIGLLSELTLFDEMKPLVYLLFLLPNIFMAYRYGWQGGVLASVMNSILLTTARQITGSFETDLELHSFIATQAIVGLGLGIAISRQYRLSKQLEHLNQNLLKELDAKQRLTRQLVNIEEEVRKSIARELHDEIGQNITAIQIQAMLAKRHSDHPQLQSIADLTHDLAMRIHSSTRRLLHKLRPQALDEMGLESAIRQLTREMRFEEMQVQFQFNCGLFSEKLDEVTIVTVYRIVQELLNNVCKHAQASEVHLTILPGNPFSLEIRDNGIGLPPNWPHRGHGLRGIEERIQALGGQMHIQSSPLGSRITVNLPTKPTATPEN
ncbi:signal transduction histidine-protein kinase/phosphatase UhpB [Vibrio cholerae]